MQYGSAYAPGHAGDPQHVHREERAVKADERQDEMQLAHALVHHPAEHLGEPVGDPAEDAKQRRAEEDVVKVGDDEVGVVEVDVDRGRPP